MSPLGIPAREVAGGRGERRRGAGSHGPDLRDQGRWTSRTRSWKPRIIRPISRGFCAQSIFRRSSMPGAWSPVATTRNQTSRALRAGVRTAPPQQVNCTSRCWFAHRETCRCPCGGQNHRAMQSWSVTLTSPIQGAQLQTIMSIEADPEVGAKVRPEHGDHAAEVVGHHAGHPRP